jgi:hypothetical protein
LVLLKRWVNRYIEDQLKENLRLLVWSIRDKWIIRLVIKFKICTNWYCKLKYVMLYILEKTSVN